MLARPNAALSELVRWGSDGPYRLGVLEVYGSHTAGHSMLVPGGQFDTDFRKRQEEKFNDSVS